MSVLDLFSSLPWYEQVFVLGGLMGGWWHFCDVMFGPVLRWTQKRPAGPPGKGSR